MKATIKQISLILFFFINASLFAENTKTWTPEQIGHGEFSLKPDQSFSYKLINKIGKPYELKIHAFFPKGHKMTNKTPAALFFHGGGWYGGTPDHFYPQCRYLALRGMVTFSAEYRTINKFKTTPKEVVKDGKSAMRWIRKNALTLGIDPHKLAAGGGSAGGHIAAATAFSKGFNEPVEDITIDCKPHALILYNPVFDNGPKGFAHALVKNYWKDFSPIDNIDKGAPPSIVILGTKDIYIPIDTAERYKKLVNEKGSRCDLHIYEGKEHGFYNLWVNKHDLAETMIRVDKFLTSLGYLKGPPTFKK